MQIMLSRICRYGICFNSLDWLGLRSNKTFTPQPVHFSLVHIKLLFAKWTRRRLFGAVSRRHKRQRRETLHADWFLTVWRRTALKRVDVHSLAATD